ncbi:MAG: hypothetical protein Q8Q67_03710 [bacterium]|nr:hypothetical protein [bacterium]
MTIAIAENIIRQWPNNLRRGLQVQWRKTVNDDKDGLISSPPSCLLLNLNDVSAPITRLAEHLGAVSLFLWTAANLQDDVYDEAGAPKTNIPLANACLHAAWNLMPRNINRGEIFKVSLETEAANMHELQRPQTIPSGKLAPAGKSSFLLFAPLALVTQLKWRPTDVMKLTLALRHFLSAKQLADDTYDYQEDWMKGRRTFAHRGLKNLPTNSELPAYYKRQANQILKLTSTCRQILKTISVLKDGDCLNKYLNPLETNCRRSLANLKRPARRA